MTRITCAILALAGGLLIMVGNASATQTPVGDDTFCVHTDNGTPVTLTHYNQKLLAWYLQTHKGSTFVGKGVCPPPVVTPPVEPPPVVTPPIPSVMLARTDNTAICSNHGEDNPEWFPIAVIQFLMQAPQPELGGKPYWSQGFLPVANHTPNVGSHTTMIGNGIYLHCNITGAPVLGHVDGTGMPVSDIDWPHVITNTDAVWHFNWFDRVG